MPVNKARDLLVILFLGAAISYSILPAFFGSIERKFGKLKAQLLAPFVPVFESFSNMDAVRKELQQTFLTAGLKRAFDIVATSLGLLALLPVFVVIIGIIKFTSPGPIFYQAKRVGKDGKVFHAYKFRSMVVNADRIGPAVTHAQDSRVTPIGRFLRHYKLDELPQLLNVIKGEMSLVGPRPEDPRYVALYTPQQREIFKVRPGITSPASVRYRDEENLLVGADWETKYVQEIMPSKLAVDLEYARNATVWKDFSIIFQTFASIVN